jgi:glycosyltransferase involved in cell wall biosynthesis
MNIVLTNDARDIAGGENFVLYLAGGLRKRGHHVIIAPLTGSDLAAKARSENHDVIEIPYSGVSKVRAINTFAKALNDKNIDVIHTNSNTDRTIGAFVAKKIGCMSVASIHSCFSIQRNVTHWYRNKFLINHFTPDGYSAKKILMEKDGIPENKITVIHIGIPPELMKFNPEARAEVRRGLHIADDEIVIGAIGRLVEFKGHTYLLKAVAKLMSMDIQKKIRVVIVGDGELRAPLATEALALGIDKQVIFTGHRTDLEGLYSSFDIFTQPSKDFGGETFPLTMLHALSFGLPVVGSDAGDMRYQIINGENGLLIQPENVDALAEALQKLINDKVLRETMGKVSLKHFTKNFTLDAMVDKIETRYRQQKRKSYS